MSDNYYVIFRGEIAEGYDANAVRQSVGDLMDEDDDTIEDLFSGRTHILKRDPDLSQCETLAEIFFSMGAVCHIRDSQGKDVQGASDHREDIPNTSEKVEEATELEVIDPVIQEKLNERLAKKISFVLANSRQGLAGSRERISSALGEVSESIKSDMEIGGMGMLMRNRFFLVLCGTALIVMLILIGLTKFDKKAMPLTEENFTIIVDHIDFIERAFTIEELEAMTKNPGDFLDYLLVDPIKKMGYEFDASIEEMADVFIASRLSPDHLQKLKNYLEITAHERNKLHELGFISETSREKLNQVAARLSQ